MKIAIVSNDSPSLLNFYGPLLVELVGRGHTVAAFSPNHGAQTRAELREIGVKPIDTTMSRAGVGPLKEIVSILSLRRELRKYGPDVSFAYSIKPVIYGTIAGWLARVPRLYGQIAGLGFSFIEGRKASPKKKLLRAAITILGRLAGMQLKRLMFLNPDDLEEFVERGIITRDKAALTGPIGVELANWPCYPLPTGPVTFLLVARLLREKGVGEFVEAARILRSSGANARFLLLGDVDDNPASFTEAEVATWTAEGLIECPGHVPVRPWLAQSHVFVLPSYYREGVPRSTQEAMAAGRAVITTDVPGCRETVRDSVNGFFVPTRDPQALAESMQRFLDDRSLIERMGKESRRMAETMFDAHQQAEKMLSAMDL